MIGKKSIEKVDENHDRGEVANFNNFEGNEFQMEVESKFSKCSDGEIQRYSHNLTLTARLFRQYQWTTNFHFVWIS